MLGGDGGEGLGVDEGGWYLILRHGSVPRKKYISMYDSDSKSSRREQSAGMHQNQESSNTQATHQFPCAY